MWDVVLTIVLRIVTRVRGLSGILMGWFWVLGLGGEWVCMFDAMLLVGFWFWCASAWCEVNISALALIVTIVRFDAEM